MVSGNALLIDQAQDACLLDGRLVCLDGAGARLLSFDPADVTAYAVELPGREAEWVMGGPGLAVTGVAGRRSKPVSRLPGLLRLNYR